MLSDVGGWKVSELASVLDVYCAMTRHHAEPNINILLTRNLPFDSDITQ